MKNLLIFTFSIYLAGCVAVGPKFVQKELTKPDNGIIYIYREPGFTFGGNAAHFYVNGINVFDLNTEGYSYLEIPAGSYTIKQKWPADSIKSIELNVRLAGGEKKYIAFETGGCDRYAYNSVCMSWKIQEVGQKEGATRIMEKKLQANFGQGKLLSLLEK